MVSDKFFMFYLYKPGAGPFLAPGAYLNNFGRGPLGDATYQVSRLGFVVSDKSFKVFISKIYFQPV